MTQLVFMIAAFLALIGIVLLTVNLTGINAGEGVFLSASLIVAVMYLSGKVLKTFQIGEWILLALSVAGFVWSILRILKKSSSADKPGTNSFACLLSPSMIVFVGVFLYVLIGFYGVFLHHIDELHLWGPIARDMVQKDTLPDWSVYGIPQMYASSFFQLFFLKITGYNEQMLYGASFLMAWIGFLLPVSSFSKKDFKKVWLYSLIVFVSIYSLFLYSYKVIYVDLICASWAGGLAAWWFASKNEAAAAVAGSEKKHSEVNSNNRRNRLLILCAGLVMICFLKSYVGILMSALILLFILFEKAGEKLAAGQNANTKSFFEVKVSATEKRFFAIVTAIGIVVLAVYGGLMLIICKGMIPSFFPSGVKLLMNASEVSMGKAVRTAGALANAFLGDALSAHSRLEVYPFAAIIGMLIWLVIIGWVYRDETKSRVRSCYVIVSSLLYLMFLFAAFVCMFSYNEAIKVAGVRRYFGIFIIYLFILCLVMWIRKDILPEKQRIVALGCFALLIVFVYGINDRFLSDATAFNDYQISGSEDIQMASAQGGKISKEIGKEDRVYFLNQSTENEYPQNVAYYYLGDQVSNYLIEPWRFTKNGCEIRIQEYETPTITDLPALLASGGYTYVWIYDANTYLAQAMAVTFEDYDLGKGMTDGQLYRVVYEDGAVTGLELVKQLNPDAEPVIKDTEEEADAELAYEALMEAQ